MRRTLIAVSVLLVAGTLLTGCGESADLKDAAAKAKDAATEGVDAVGNLAEQGGAVGMEWMADAEGMIAKLPEEMQAKATELKSTIDEQQGKLKEIKAKLAEMKPADALSSTGKELKGEAEQITTKLDELKGELKTMLSKATG